MTGEELIAAIEMQYRTIVQMNRLLNEMVEEARTQGLVREMYTAVNRVNTDIGVGPLDSPPLII